MLHSKVKLKQHLCKSFAQYDIGKVRVKGRSPLRTVKVLFLQEQTACRGFSLLAEILNIKGEYYGNSKNQRRFERYKILLLS